MKTSWMLLLSFFLLLGCQNVKDVSDGIEKSSGDIASNVGTTAKNAVDTAGGIAGGTGKAAVDAAKTAGLAAGGITTDLGNMTLGAAAGAGDAANKVREGAIETFGVREVKTTERFYYNELKPIFVIPADKGDLPEKKKDSEI